MAVIKLLADFFTYNVAVFLLVLGVLIFAHEFGHFLFARLFGVRVLVFKLGFGRFLWSVKRGHTEYGVGLFPIGGYVRLFGDPTEIEEGEQPPAELAEADRRETLWAQPAWKRFCIFAGGPVFNIVLAFLIAPLVYLVGIEKLKADVEPPTVQKILPLSPADRAGFQVGDVILSVGGFPTPTAQDLKIQEFMNPGRNVSYRVLRGGRELNLPVSLEEDPQNKSGYSGLLVYLIPAAVVEATPDGPADRAGILPGDKILAVADYPVESYAELPRLIQLHGGRPTRFLLEREGQTRELTITPEKDPAGRKWIIGIAFEPAPADTVVVRTGLGEAVRRGAEDAYSAGALTFQAVYKMLTFQVSAGSVGGPVMIAGVIGQAAHGGFSYLVSLVVLISVNLGVLNLLPIPPLDGGHILFSLIEAVRRREVALRTKEAVFRVGMAFFLALFVLITVNDVLRMKSGIFSFFSELAKGLGLL